VPFFAVIFSVQFLPQYPRALECDDLPWCEHHVVSSGSVPAFSFWFLFHAEFSETGNQYFDGFNEIFPGEAFGYGIDNVVISPCFSR